MRSGAAYNPRSRTAVEGAMIFLHLLPAIVSVLLLFGHAFREVGPIVLPFVGVLTLLLVPHGFVARFFQFFLCLGALEWARLAISHAIERQSRGEPWIRMAIILGALSLFTLWAAVLFESDELRRVYPRRSIL
jgi:hypothetical protein